MVSIPSSKTSVGMMFLFTSCPDDSRFSSFCTEVFGFSVSLSVFPAPEESSSSAVEFFGSSEFLSGISRLSPDPLMSTEGLPSSVIASPEARNWDISVDDSSGSGLNILGMSFLLVYS